MGQKVNAFTHLPKKRAIKLQAAADKVNGAIADLKEAQKCAENWTDYATIKHFIMELETFMSHDHGQAGFHEMVEGLEGRDYFYCQGCGSDTEGHDDCGHGYCSDCAFGLGRCKVCEADLREDLMSLS